MAKSRVFDLLYQLVQYASHHNNPVNVGIHLTCIPLLLWSALVFAAKSGPLVPTPSTSKVRANLFRAFPPNAGMLLMAACCVYYIMLDGVVGLLTTPLFLGVAKHATNFQLTNPRATKVATCVQVIAWTAQFIGHGVYEKRAPKMTKNLLQALALAPYFVVYEVLFAVGFRPNLKGMLDQLVEADIRAFKARQTTKKKDE